MKKTKNTTKEIISEMKLMLDDNNLTLESFMLPEDMEEPMDDFHGEDSFSEGKPYDRPEQEKMMPDKQDDISGIEKELTQIRKIALSVINRLADQPQSPQYDTMKKIWNMVDKAIEQPSKGQPQSVNA